MGGFISSAEAVITCAYAEHQWLSSLGVDSHLSACRYIDDLRSVIAYDCTDHFSKRKAEFLANELLNECYPKSLKLEKEELELSFDSVEYRFLEAKITTTRNTSTVQHWNKNIASIMETGTQKFLNLQHARSFGNRNTKRGVIISRVMAIDRISSSETLKFYAVMNLFLELRLLGYSCRMLKQVCRNM